MLERVVKIQLDFLFNSLFANGPFKYYYGKLVFIYFISISWISIEAYIKI